MNTTYSDDFHIYSVNWTPGQITWSVDGNVYFTAKPIQTRPYWPFVGNLFNLFSI
jgi:beta-glucanase (GH16 family)